MHAPLRAHLDIALQEQVQQRVQAAVLGVALQRQDCRVVLQVVLEHVWKRTKSTMVVAAASCRSGEDASSLACTQR